MFVDYSLEKLFGGFFLMKCKLKSSHFRGLKKIEITVEAKIFLKSTKKLITQ